MDKNYKKYLTQLEVTNKYRKLKCLPESTKKLHLNFSSNDYLGLSTNPKLLKAASEAGRKYGVGSTGSRLLSGNNSSFEKFETIIAKDKFTESSLVFNSGFQANLTTLSSILDAKILEQRPLVFCDKLNHSSLYQAILLSGAEMLRYSHNDMGHLSDLLEQYTNSKQPKYIVTETIFGMDGDLLPINEVICLAKKHRAFLYLDEAHATGILGKNGYGLSTMIDFDDVPHIIMGTFSKALGCCGAYIACSEIVKNYLINKAPGFIYSTANSPMIFGAASKAWELVKDFDMERKYLFSLASKLRTKLVNLGFDIGKSKSHIVPLILGSENLAVAVSNSLLDNKIIVSCIRPPTVLPNTSRVRIALNINHSEDDINRLTDLLKKI
jgi:8-amino-7-oxononanoate synthase